MQSRLKLKMLALLAFWYVGSNATPVRAFDWCYDVCSNYSDCSTSCYNGYDTTCGGFGTCEACGDGVCGNSEDCNSCSQDCGRCLNVCGDGYCDFIAGGYYENFVNCPQDCGTCGDGVCGGPGSGVPNGEGSCDCPQDCGNGSYCTGGGSCNANCDEGGCTGCTDTYGNTYNCINHTCMPLH